MLQQTKLSDLGVIERIVMDHAKARAEIYTNTNKITLRQLVPLTDCRLNGISPKAMTLIGRVLLKRMQTREEPISEHPKGYDRRYIFTSNLEGESTFEIDFQTKSSCISIAELGPKWMDIHPRKVSL